MKFLRKYGLYLFLALQVVILVAAAALARRLGNSMVDVGLDLDHEPSRAPLLASVDANKAIIFQAEMKPVKAAYAPPKYSFELQATGKKNAHALRSEVWIQDSPELSSLTQTPPDSWKRKDGFIYSSADNQPASLRWTGTRLPALTFKKNAYCGLALLKTSSGTKEIDLYDAKGTAWTAPLAPAGSLARYHASIPRKMLSRIRLVFPDASGNEIHRLFIGTMIPRIFSMNRSMGNYTLGKLVPGWRPQISKDTVVVPPLAPYERGGILTFLVIFAAFNAVLGAAAVLTALGVLFLIYCIKAPPVERTLRPFSWKAFLAFFVPLLLLWLTVLGAFWPGAMTNDCVSQWRQARTNYYTDSHPAFHTLTIKAITTVWESPAAVCLVQILAASAVLAYGFSLLIRAGVSRVVVIIVYLAALFSPRNANLMIIPWKDIPFSILMLLVSIMVTVYFVQSGVGRKKWFWIALALLMSALPLYRHNGLIVTLFLIVAMPFAAWPHKKLAIVSALICLALFFSVKKGLYRAMNVHADPALAPGFVAGKIQLPVQEDYPLTSEECDFVNGICPWGPGWNSIDVTWQPGFNMKFIKDNDSAAWGLFNSMFQRYPGIYLWPWAIQLRFILRPTLAAGEMQYPPYTYNFVIAPIGEKFNLRQDPLFPGIRTFLLDSVYPKTNLAAVKWLFWKPSIHFYLILISAIVLLVRFRDPRLLVIHGINLVNVFGLYLAGALYAYRYLFPLTLCSGFLFALAFLPRNKPE